MTTYLVDGYNQSDDPNKNWKKVGLYIVAIILACLLASLFSCNPAKQLEKAKQKVITDSTAFDYVGRTFVALHPCANIIKYKSDTLITHDTTETSYHFTDTLNHTDTVVKKITIHDKQIIHDTTTVIDNEAIKLLQEQLTQRNLQIATMNGQLIQSNDATKQAESNTNKWKLLFGGLVTLLGLGAAWRIYTSLKPKI